MISKSGGYLPSKDDPSRHVPGLRAALWRRLGRLRNNPAWFYRGWNRQTYYLGAGGSDSNDGLTWKTRRQTIAGAEREVYPGDTVYCG